MEAKDINILVLDDEPMMLKLLKNMLVSQGYFNITMCDNSVKALGYIREKNNHPDLIFCDLMMPEMDGIEYVNHLVKCNYTGNLILVSGVEERILQTVEKLAHSNNIRILGYLHKPFRIDLFASLLTKVTPHLEALAKKNEKNIYKPEEVSEGIKCNELLNYYQPKIDFTTGMVVGVESLVRWQHPRDGLVYPDQFVGVAEEKNLIDELTEVVIYNAVSQTKKWLDAGVNIRVAVNVSMENLKSLDFPDIVACYAESSGVSPRNIILEVTESRLMIDPRAALEILTRLRLKGFLLSIDDFGTGHSSFTQLHDIPFSELKIDRSFVHNVSSNNTKRAIFNASLNLAKQLEMEVVAEGIEEKKDWDFVAKTGCHMAQGYYIAKPMHGDEVLDYLIKANSLDS